MKRSTETLSLVLIGSALMLGVAGCRSRTEEEERNGSRGGGMGGVGAGYMAGRMLSGPRAGGGGTAPGVSARGGFGGSHGSAIGG